MDLEKQSTSLGKIKILKIKIINNNNNNKIKNIKINYFYLN